MSQLFARQLVQHARPIHPSKPTPTPIPPNLADSGTACDPAKEKHCIVARGEAAREKVQQKFVFCSISSSFYSDFRVHVSLLFMSHCTVLVMTLLQISLLVRIILLFLLLFLIQFGFFVNLYFFKIVTNLLPIGIKC